ncbi:MAG: sulfite exporter TauE/SafE family protein [Thermoleophilia bacterium]
MSATPGLPAQAPVTPVAPEAPGAPAVVSPPSWARPAVSFAKRHVWWVAGAAWAVASVVVYGLAGAHLNPYLSLTGLLIGFLVGLTGMGGGALMTPILVFFFGFKPTLAVGTDVTYGAITKTFGAWRHWRLGSVDLPLVLYLALGSVPSTLVGVGLVHYLQTNYGAQLDSILYRAIGVALVIVGVTLVARSVVKVDASHRRENIALSTRRKVFTVMLGAATGFVVGLTSVGSGTFLGMFLLTAYPLATSRVVGTDVFQAAILLYATAIAQASIGNVNLWMVAALLVGSIPGIIAGSHLTIRTPTRALRLCLAAVLLVSGFVMYGKA